jgi:hypothetical protein
MSKPILIIAVGVLLLILLTAAYAQPGGPPTGSTYLELPGKSFYRLSEIECVFVDTRGDADATNDRLHICFKSGNAVHESDVAHYETIKDSLIRSAQ